MSDRLNILFLSSWYPNDVTRTKGNFVQRHAEAVATVCNVCAIVVIEDPNRTNEAYHIDRKMIKGVDTICVYTKPGLGKYTKWLRFFRGHDKAIKLVLESFQPDVIHGNVIFPVGIVVKKWAWRLKVPYVFTEHLTSYLPVNRSHLKSRHLKSIRNSAKTADKILPVSNDLMLAMKELNIGRNYEVVPNVVDTDLFKPLEKQRYRKRLIHVSTAKDYHKNISGILRTIAKLKDQRDDFELLIISDGETISHQHLARELGVSELVIFEGEQPIDEVGRKMGASDAFLLFSNFENLPCVIIEALSAGIPVISSNVGGIPEMVNEHNGVLVNPGDEVELLRQINFVLDSNQFDSEAISKSARDKYSIQAVSSHILRIYKEVIKKK